MLETCANNVLASFRSSTYPRVRLGPSLATACLGQGVSWHARVRQVRRLACLIILQKRSSVVRHVQAIEILTCRNRLPQHVRTWCTHHDEPNAMLVCCLFAGLIMGAGSPVLAQMPDRGATPS